VILLHEGEICWQGNKDEIMSSDNEILHDFIFASPFLQRLRNAAVSNGFHI
jgi:phospholipid/cholesterol/gamma-HCH transport system ATP-binding protein